MKERIVNMLCWLGIFLAGAGISSIVIATRVHGHDMPGATPQMQEWYKNAKTNPEARPTFTSPWTLCCNHAEVIPVKDIIFPTSEHGWQWNDEGVVKNIPDVIIHWSESAPDNQPTLFVYLGQMTCFYPPQGGA